MEIFVVAVLVGLIPAFIAHGKGRSFFGWWIYGSAIFIVALPHALIMKTYQKGIDQQHVEEGRRACPHCAEFIRPEAKVCRYCGRDVVVTTFAATAPGGQRP